MARDSVEHFAQANEAHVSMFVELLALVGEL